LGRYQYECQECRKRYIRHKRMSNLDVPELCATHHTPMQRLFTASFQIIGCMEKDKDENKLYKILTKGSGSTDEVALMRQDEKRMERDFANMPEQKKEFGADEILATGIIEASRTEEGLANWRKEHIPEKSYTKDEVIPV
jgi:hypothetical protein